MAGIVANVMLAPAARAGDAGDAGHDSREPPLAASMTCDRAAEPGRVKCSIEAHATSGRVLAWADVVLIELPDFTAALKGRIGPADATARDATAQRWAFGLVARRVGEGEAKVRVRGVVCEPASAAGGDASAPTCTPAMLDVRATIRVG